MTHQDIEQMWDRMQGITTRFLAAVNYRGNSALSLFPQYPQSSSSSASTGRSYRSLLSSSRPPFPVTFYVSLFVARPLVHPHWRMHPPRGPGSRAAVAPAPRGPTTTTVPARAPPLVPLANVPSSSTGIALPSGNGHNSISNHIQIQDSINYDTRFNNTIFSSLAATLLTPP
jgi:hypothetical protein